VRVAIAAAFVASCSISGLESYSGGPNASTSDGGAADAGAPAEAAGAAGDGGDGGDASAALPCPATAFFCDDFERSTVLGSSWTLLSGKPTIASSDALGWPGRCLSATVAAGQDLPFVSRSFTNAPLRVQMTFAVYVADRPTDAHEIFKAFYDKPGGDVENVALSVAAAGLNLTMQNYPNYIAATVLEADSFYDRRRHVVTVQMDHSVTPRLARATVDGVLRPDVTLQPVNDRAPTGLELLAGVTYGDNTAAFGPVYIDDIALSVY
jgi:hypothetical protein